MHGRLGAALVVAFALAAASIVVAAPAPQAQAARMCPPVTLDDLFPEPARPSPTPSPTTTTPGAGESTSTTSAETTTTTAPPATTDTTVPGTDSTTVTNGPDDGSTPQQPQPKPASKCIPFRYDMAWPLAGRGQIMSAFGADRDGGERHHKGNDISAPKLTPVVAVADGVVTSVTQEVGTEDCCWISLRHNDGWQSYYIHLNNDHWGTDDGLGFGVRVDLVEGMEVTQGEVIGWVGDSGNAEESVDHLHFELRTPAGVAVDPGASLKAAQRQAELDDPQPLWPYADDDGLDTEGMAATLLSEGLFLPCDENIAGFCPDEVASPAFAAAIVQHLTGKAPPPVEGRYQPLPSSLDPGLVLPRTLEEAFGCAPIEECLDFGIAETDIARLAAWARLDAVVSEVLPQDPFFESAPTVRLATAGDAEARLREEGMLGECNPPLDDTGLVSRDRALLLLVSWIQGVNPESCSAQIQRTR